MPANQWRNWRFWHPGAEAMKRAPLENRRLSLTPTVRFFLVKNTTVVVSIRQLPCNSVIFL